MTDKMNINANNGAFIIYTVTLGIPGRYVYTATDEGVNVTLLFVQGIGYVPIITPWSKTTNTLTINVNSL